jgi:hypothetical protein
LKRAIFDDLLPSDKHTNEIWGFNRAELSQEGPMGPSYLLGLYQGLVKILDIDTQQLDQWRQRGTLVPEIKAVFEKIPVTSRGAYYPWLLRNEYVLNRSKPIPFSNTSNASDVANAILQSGWNYATNNHPACVDTIRAKIASWPVRKQECIRLCGMAFHSYIPPPELELWRRFGFCAGHRRSEAEVLEMYKKLLRLASFDEFYEAYDEGQLVNLLDKKGLTQAAGYKQIEEEFKDVVEGSARGVLKSAWHLKVAIHGNPNSLRPEGLKIQQSVYVDYGWINCADLQSTNRLLRVYQQYFNSPLANCAKLHSACITGTLAEYLKGIPGVSLQRADTPLFKNFYPLPPPEGNFDATEHSDGLVYDKSVIPGLTADCIPASTANKSNVNGDSILFGAAIALLGVGMTAVIGWSLR